jgi:hypothetical protein
LEDNKTAFTDKNNATTVLNSKWRTRVAEYKGETEMKMKEFKNGKETFNTLSPIPDQDIQLGDGRVLRVQGWRPKGDPEVWSLVKIKITDYICMPEKETDDDFLKKSYGMLRDLAQKREDESK